MGAKSLNRNHMIILLLFILSNPAEAKVDHGKLLEVDHADKSSDCKEYDYAVILMDN